MAFLTGWTLLGGEVGHDLRGRVSGFVEAGGRVALLVSIAVAGVTAGNPGPPAGPAGHWRCGPGARLIGPRRSDA